MWEEILSLPKDLKEKNECLTWTLGRRRQEGLLLFWLVLGQAGKSSCPHLSPDLWIFLCSVWFWADFYVVGMGIGRRMTVVEHTAGTWPCLPSAHHFLPEPAESVVFSQAITQEQREPDHSVDLFLVWRIFCKKSELYYYHEMGWWQYLYCSKCMGPRRCDLCPFQRLVDHQCFPTKETAEAARSFLILSSYQLHLEVKCMLCLLKQWGCVTHDKS